MCHIWRWKDGSGSAFFPWEARMWLRGRCGRFFSGQETTEHQGQQSNGEPEKHNNFRLMLHLLQVNHRDIFNRIYMLFCLFAFFSIMLCRAFALQDLIVLQLTWMVFVYRVSLQLIHQSEPFSLALCVLTAGRKVTLFIFIPPST